MNTKPFDNVNEFNGYEIDSRSTFEALASDALIARAANFTGSLVLWDPMSDDDGFLIVSDNRDILVQSYIDFFEFA